MIDKARFEQYKGLLNKRLQQLKELQEEHEREVLQMFSKGRGGEE